MSNSNEVPIPEEMREQFQSRRQDELDRTAAVIQEQLTKGNRTMRETRQYRHKETGEIITAQRGDAKTVHCAHGANKSGIHIPTFPLSRTTFERDYEPMFPSTESKTSEIRYYQEKKKTDQRIRARQLDDGNWHCTCHLNPGDMPISLGFILAAESFHKIYEVAFLRNVTERQLAANQESLSATYAAERILNQQRGPAIPNTDEVMTLRMLFAAEAKPEEFVLCVLQNGAEEDARKEWNDLDQPGSLESWEALSDTGRFVRGVAHVKRMLADESLRMLKETE